MTGADLPTVRRFEAAGFRAWPCERAFYDGTWSVRLTPDMKARRLNSINPLDRGDAARIDERIKALRPRFDAAGRPLAFRISPLTSPELIDHLDAGGWEIITPSLVQRADLAAMPLGETGDVEQVSNGAFIDAAVAIGNLDIENARGFGAVLRRIQPEVALFHATVDRKPAANAICVRDGGIAGLFEVATAPDMRGQGLARKVVAAAFGWARDRGATTGWLQVEETNAPALGLYRSLGFETIYGYHYRTEPKGAT